MPLPQLKVRTYPDPCLRRKSQKVKAVGPGERLLIQSMITAMYAHKGVGLAAPQVGINQQIFVADIGQGPMAVINPQVVEQHGSTVLEEGCLSIPGVTVKIKRPKKILVKYMDEENTIVQREFSDLMARVFLHESDHLFGKLIVDYVGLRQKKEVQKHLKMLEDIQKNPQESSSQNISNSKKASEKNANA
ncbi:MAG: peptide deformylase [Candidatus Omnitrophica bacterium]|nr:peptide deformylase [Candidatus Omnitrophota bacterium]